MQDQLDDFLNLSSELTGFSRFRLIGTGQAGEYFRTICEIVPGNILADLWTAFRQLPQGQDRDAAIEEKILADQKLGPVAKNLILLWYCGTWTSLPENWRAAYGASPLDTNRVISGQAYQSALQWLVVEAHAPGSAQQGFASWAASPERSAS